MVKLTKRQQEILALIEAHISKHCSPPTRAEIAKMMGFKSPNAAEDHLRALARKGVIELVPGTSRGIKLALKSGIPLIHTPSQPLNFYISNKDTITTFLNLNTELFSNPFEIALKVSSKCSQPELGIFTNDILLITLNLSSIPPSSIIVSRTINDIMIKKYTGTEQSIEGIVVGLIKAFAPFHMTNE